MNIDELNNRPIFYIMLIAIFISIASCKSNKKAIASNDNKKKLVAYLNNSKFIYSIDTLKFKSEISSTIFSPDSAIEFDKIEIIKQYSIGEEIIPFYYILLTDFDKKVKTARWLSKENDSLYFNNDLNKEKENFDLIYLTCAGENNCNPQLFIFDNKRSWACSDNPMCLRDGHKVDGCDVYITFIDQ